MKIEAWNRAKALPLMKVDGRFAVAFSDPFDLPTQEEVSRWTRGKIWTLVAPAPELNDALDATLDAAGEAPVIRMVNTIMIEASRRRRPTSTSRRWKRPRG